MSARPPVRLDVFVAAVVLGGFGVLAIALVGLDPHDLTRAPAALLVLSVVLVVGELNPIEVPRGDRPQDAVTVSGTFAYALALTQPLAAALVAMTVAVALDEVRRGWAWRRSAFNIAQYLLALGATRAGYAALTHRPVLSPGGAFTARDLLPALLAAATFFVINNALVETVVPLARGERILPHLLADIPYQLSTTGILLALGPALVQAVDFSVWLIPLLLLPIAAVHGSARMARERERQALHDSLTGLPNRALFRDRVDRALGEGSRTQRALAVMILDLDHFKEINDTLGHHVGDLLLLEVSRRLDGLVRAGDTVARLGGDEFAVLAPNLTAAALDAREMAQRLIDALQVPFTIESVRLDVQASIGIALAPEHGADVQSLMQRADVALYIAKELRGTYALYDYERDRHSPERLALLGDLRRGLEAGELVLHYQPQLATVDGVVVGVEALVRWQHPVRGLIAPAEFLPVAENTGLIGPLTLRVLDLALAQTRRWRMAGLPVKVAVNLSVRHLTDLELPVQVAQALDRWGLPPSALTLEVTETTIMADPTRAVTVLRLLHDVGITLAVDDFGTGYSSLSYLRRLDVDELKIDRSFVQNMAENEDDATIVRSTVELGHNLGLRVVAEGVETQAQHRLLANLGCDVVQGYLVSRPLPPEDLSPWLGSRSFGAAVPVVDVRPAEPKAATLPTGTAATGTPGRPARRRGERTG